MKKAENLITMKIAYQCETPEIIKEYQRQYSNVLHFTYNRLLENKKLKTSEITALQKELKNVDLIKSHLKNSAIYNSKELINRSDEPIVFGGKKNFKLRCQNKIIREEFLEKRLSPICSIGEANHKGNRFFEIIDTNTILFKPDKNHHIELIINPNIRRQKELFKIKELVDNCLMPVTISLDKDYIYLTYNYNIVHKDKYRIKQNRVMAIDMNPNFIGWSVCDWKRGKYQIVDKGEISFKGLNDKVSNLEVASTNDKFKKLNRIRKHEIIEAAKFLYKKCKHYKCEVFSMEDLNFKDSKQKGKARNRLNKNQWCRKLLEEQLTKRILASSTYLQKVQAQYSSIVGNLVYREEKLPDPILASIEIGRRGNEFCNQYVFKRRKINKTIILPRFKTVKSRVEQSLEELGYPKVLNDWSELWSVVKKSGLKYRFPRGESAVFSRFYKHNNIIEYIW